jgi:exo-beta-1,3-glucanase (GH17 family)
LGRVDIKIAGFYLQEMYSKTLGLANKKVIISETGWPGKGEQYNLQFLK